MAPPLPSPAPADAWASQPQWRVLATSFGDGLDFLSTWHAWRRDPRRPGLLHYACALPWPGAAAQWEAITDPGLAPLARELAAHWWGLLPGLHRISLEGGRVLLTLWVGGAGEALREFAFAADAVRLDAAAVADADLLKAAGRLCRRGARLQAPALDATARRHLATAGFACEAHRPEAVYDPAWTPKTRHTEPLPATECLVIGGGLAGTAAAWSLSRRGWRVQVLDAAPEPAAGASGLPAGLLAPHLSPDDNLLSRLSRHGVRATLGHARALLAEGTDWRGGGILEHRIRPGARALQAEGFAADWSRAAGPEAAQAAGLPPGALAAWHARAGWVRPGALARAWLADSGAHWLGGCRVEAIVREGDEWVAKDTGGLALARAPLVVVAAALGSAPLSGGRLWLNPVRGQVSWGPLPDGARLPPFPVNGNGHLLPEVPMPGGPAWMCGATYGRAQVDLAERAADHAANLAKLETLLPDAARQLAPAFATGQVRAWTGVRCASADRRSLVGPLEPGLWVATAMGSRGLTFAALSAELMAARLHGEPLPLPRALAAALDAARQLAPRSSSGSTG